MTRRPELPPPPSLQPGAPGHLVCGLSREQPFQSKGTGPGDKGLGGPPAAASLREDGLSDGVHSTNARRPPLFLQADAPGAAPEPCRHKPRILVDFISHSPRERHTWGQCTSSRVHSWLDFHKCTHAVSRTPSREESLASQEGARCRATVLNAQIQSLRFQRQYGWVAVICGLLFSAFNKARSHSACSKHCDFDEL